MMLTKEGYDDMFAGPWVMRDHGDDDADDDADSSWCWQLMMVTADDAD